MNITKEYEKARFRRAAQRDQGLMSRTLDEADKKVIRHRLKVYMTHLLELDGHEDKEPVYDLEVVYYIKALMYLEYQLDAYEKMCADTFAARDPINALRRKPRTLYEMRVLWVAATRILSILRTESGRSATTVWGVCLQVADEIKEQVLDPRVNHSCPVEHMHEMMSLRAKSELVRHFDDVNPFSLIAEMAGEEAVQAKLMNRSPAAARRP